MEKEYPKLLKIEVTGIFRSVYHVRAFDEEDALNIMDDPRENDYIKVQSSSSKTLSRKRIK